VKDPAGHLTNKDSSRAAARLSSCWTSPVGASTLYIGNSFSGMSGYDAKDEISGGAGAVPASGSVCVQRFACVFVPLSGCDSVVSGRASPPASAGEAARAHASWCRALHRAAPGCWRGQGGVARVRPLIEFNLPTHWCRCVDEAHSSNHRGNRLFSETELSSAHPSQSCQLGICACPVSPLHAAPLPFGCCR